VKLCIVNKYPSANDSDWLALPQTPLGELTMLLQSPDQLEGWGWGNPPIPHPLDAFNVSFLVPAASHYLALQLINVEKSDFNNLSI